MSPLNITQPLDSIRYMVYNGYYKVMSNIPKMGHLTTPVLGGGCAARVPLRRRFETLQVPMQVDQAPVQMQASVYFGVPIGQPLYGDTGYRFVCKGTPKIRRLRLIES